MKSRKVQFVVLQLVLCAFTCVAEPSEDKIDLSFLQGGALAPEWADLDGAYVPGRYFIDVILNREKLGKTILDISAEDKDVLCLSMEWLHQAGIYIDTSFFSSVFQEERGCYLLAKRDAVTLDFDVATSSLSLIIPQQGLSSEPEDSEWDHGTTALRINYNLNGSGSNNGSGSGFWSTQLLGNAGAWAVTSSASGKLDAAQNDAQISMFTATRAIRPLQSDLSVGKSYVGGDMFGSVGTYGASLSHNPQMVNNIGYTPLFSGIANTYARVSLVQAGTTLYSEMVPPGPFVIDNVSLLTSGDVLMTIREEDGSVREQLYPLSVMPNQLGVGKHDYTLALGVPDDQSDVEGGLLSASYGYGLDGMTLRASTALHQDYQGISFGVVKDLGSFGGLSLTGGYATAQVTGGGIKANQEELDSSGRRVQTMWSKTLSDWRTGLRLGWDRRLTPTFPTLGDIGTKPAAPRDTEPTPPSSTTKRQVKNEWSAGISQGVGKLASMGVSGWYRDFWFSDATESGGNASISTQVASVSLQLSGSYSQRSDGSADRGIYLSASVPFGFTLGETPISGSTGISHQYGGDTSYDVALNTSGERTSYNLNGSFDDKGSRSWRAGAGYRGDAVNLNGATYQSSTALGGYVSASGGILLVPEVGGVLFHRSLNDTLGVVHVPDTPGVKVVGVAGETDSKGNLVVPLNAYQRTRVTLDTATLPTEVEIPDSSQQIVAASRAVAVVPFEKIVIQRYLLQVRTADGAFVPSGRWAFDQNKVPLGFVGPHGVLSFSVMDAPAQIKIGSCLINGSQLTTTETVQEIKCEQ